MSRSPRSMRSRGGICRIICSTSGPIRGRPWCWSPTMSTKPWCWPIAFSSCARGRAACLRKSRSIWRGRATAIRHCSTTSSAACSPRWIARSTAIWQMPIRKPRQAKRCGGDNSVLTDYIRHRFNIRESRKMDAAELRATQAPIKDRYKSDPKAAMITLKAKGSIENEGIACKVETGRALAVAGLHPASGGSGLELCSGDMLLEALVACAGVTLKSVATAIEVPLKKGDVTAEGDLDFRGTLGVDKEAPVGFAEIRLRFDVDTSAPQDKLDLLLKLTERYCVVYQTVKNGPKLSVTMHRV